MRSLIIFLFFLFVQITYCRAITGNAICRKETACRCRYNDGTGINIGELGIKKSVLITPLSNSSIVYFHPCSDTTVMPDPACNNTSLCIKSNGTYQSIGTAIEANFVSPKLNENVNKLVYTHGDIITNIALICVENFAESHMVQLDTPTNTKILDLALYSPSACIVDFPSEGLSTGSILVMLLLITSGVYFIGGGAALYFLRGARGREMIPHVDFWTDLPYLVRDGAVFLQNGCKVIPSGADVYEQI